MVTPTESVFATSRNSPVSRSQFKSGVVIIDYVVVVSYSDVITNCIYVYDRLKCLKYA